MLKRLAIILRRKYPSLTVYYAGCDAGVNHTIIDMICVIRDQHCVLNICQNALYYESKVGLSCIRTNINDPEYFIEIDNIIRTFS